MKPENSYRLFVRWSEEDRAYVGHCPDLFPWGGVCHGTSEKATYRKLHQLVREEAARASSPIGYFLRRPADYARANRAPINLAPVR